MNSPHQQMEMDFWQHQMWLNDGKHDAASSEKSRHSHEMEKRKNHSAQGSTGSKNSLATDARTASRLKNVHAMLHKTDANCQGLRANAINHVADATRHLGENTLVQTGYEYGRGNMSQSKSDRMLGDAMFQLHQIEGSLGTGSNTLAQHGHARTSVAEAIHQLEIARRIR
jgi:hypothetical protein